MKLGILGGGQLGRMLLQAAANYDIETFILECDDAAPAAHLCHQFVHGDIKDYDAVYQFGKQVDVLTIEIEHVNIEALEQLEREGLNIIPRPAALKIINDKGLQKEFYKANSIPTSDFVLTDASMTEDEVRSYIPFAQKMRTGGYDGKGVQLIKSDSDIAKLFAEDSVLEKMVDIKNEISVIVAVGQNGESVVYEPVEMAFDPELNLVDYLIAPALLSSEIALEAEQIATNAVKALNSPGIFAVELFLTQDNHVLVNEIAPRAHNSGHATIESNTISQYEMQLRIFQNFPLITPKYHHYSLMYNLIGANGFTGKVKYPGIEEVLMMEGVFVHLYGKQNTKPGRKMGHITVIDKQRESLFLKLEFIKGVINVTSG
jgi:5-(carboxyamino)imidazole ribonucleotide synthase